MKVMSIKDGGHVLSLPGTIDELWKDTASVTLDSGAEAPLMHYVTMAVASRMAPNAGLPTTADFPWLGSTTKSELESSFVEFCNEFNFDCGVAWELAESYLTRDPDDALPVSEHATDWRGLWSDTALQATRGSLRVLTDDGKNRFTLAGLTALSGPRVARFAEGANYLKEQILVNVRFLSACGDKASKAGMTAGLPVACLATVLAATEDVRVVDFGVESDSVTLALYQYRGPQAGMWVRMTPDAPGPVATLAEVLLGKSDSKTMATAFSAIASTLRERRRTIRPLAMTPSPYVAVADGIVDVRKDIGRSDYCRHTDDCGCANAEYTRKFQCIHVTDMSFKTVTYGVFHRCPVGYDPEAPDVEITMPDGETWRASEQIRQTFGGSERSEEVFFGWSGRALRGNNSRTTMLLMDASETAGGGGGKSTIVDMYKKTAGEADFFEKTLDAMCDADFGFQGIEFSRGVIINDNDSTVIQKIASFKSMITGEPIFINAKYRAGYSIPITVPVIMASNYGLKVMDADTAFYRRFTVLECPSSFCTGGERRDYIKTDYVLRPEVSRYFLRRAIETAGTTEAMPPEDVAHCAPAMYRMRAKSSSVYAFWAELKTVGVLNTEMPLQYYFDAYTAFCKATGRKGCNLGTFEKVTQNWLNDNRGCFVMTDYSSSGGMVFNGGYVPDEFIGRWPMSGASRWTDPLDRRLGTDRDKRPAPRYVTWVKKVDSSAGTVGVADRSAYYEYIGRMIEKNGRDVQLLTLAEFVARGGASRYAGARWLDVEVAPDGFDARGPQAMTIRKTA